MSVVARVLVQLLVVLALRGGDTDLHHRSHTAVVLESRGEGRKGSRSAQRHSRQRSAREDATQWLAARNANRNGPTHQFTENSVARPRLTIVTSSFSGNKNSCRTPAKGESPNCFTVGRVDCKSLYVNTLHLELRDRRGGILIE